MAEKSTALDDNLHWYKDAIIYELHIKAFRDGSGDGIGDFGGLLEKLDYLQELGVTAIWVLPFYPSPLKDDGYDIADYYSINPRYGTLEQFKQFLNEAHRRGLKVITELVINHTSDQHPWFQRARTAPKGSPERDFYVWTDDPTKYKDVRIIFQDFEASNWTWDPVAQQYYWHRFFHHQPDLNYDNPQVREEIYKVLHHWCAMGVDGFRLDAVPYLFEREGTNGENLPETHGFLKKLRQYVDEHFPGTVFLAEANMWPEDSASYFGNGDECHMNYHFPVMPRMFMSLQMEDRYPITDIFAQTPDIPETCQWAIFLRNHDELTLEMVTDEERDFMYKVYAKDPKARINLGIRHRLAPLMDNDRRKIELMNSLLFSLPGTPVIYYGDEIGMGDNFYLGDRDGVRTPMQWSPDRNAGFSMANPHQLYLPVILDPEYHYEAVNVEMQRRNTSSLLWFMKRIITMRKNFKAFGRGDLKFIYVDNPKVLAFTRTYKDETLLVVVNLSKYAQPAELDLSFCKGAVPVEVFSKNKFPLIRENSPYFFTLSPYAFQWFRLENVQSRITEKKVVPTLSAAEWNGLAGDRTLQALQNTILPQYLKSRSWFKGKNKNINSISTAHREVVQREEGSVLLMVLEVAYESGLPEFYQLALTCMNPDAAKEITVTYPEAVVAFIDMEGEQCLLCDAFYNTDVQRYLFDSIRKNKTINLERSHIRFTNNGRSTQPAETDGAANPKMHLIDENNTSITYENAYFLKLYRKLDFAMNPDVEISRYLSEQRNFQHIPAFLGTIEWQLDKRTLTLGMMQEMIENHGNGHTYMLERINNYIERIRARDWKKLNPAQRLGTLTSPQGMETLPEELQVLLGGRTAEFATLLGLRTAEMHQVLASEQQVKDLKPEEFSLHYQRSLFSSMTSLVRETYQSLDRNKSRLPHGLKEDVQELAGQQQRILDLLKRIYEKKLDIPKIRIHGNYSLSEILLTGKDLAVQDFGGNTERSFSERRLKRSPLRDVVAMVCSFYYTAYEGFLSNNQVPKEELQELLPFAEQWAHYNSGFFMKSYLENTGQTQFIPKDEKDFQIVMQTFLLESALIYLRSEAANRPEWVVVPLRLIQSLLKAETVAAV
jgi:maltose alpha-D-glucosyltransferase/alpha-amylase